MLRTLENETFAQGRAQYQFHAPRPGGRDERIFINIEVEGVQTTAALDTGGLYLVLNPAFADAIGLSPDEGIGERNERGQLEHSLKIRGEDFWGVLHRVTLNFPVTEGQGCSIEATAFVPDAKSQTMWDSLGLPNFLGFYNCMDRVRFAIDHENEFVYFGAGEMVSLT